MDYLNPSDIANFDAQSNALRTTYGRSLAHNTYDKGQADLDYGLGKSALTQKWDAYRQQLPGAYTHRGLGNSGIYQRGLNDYAQQREMGFQGLQRQYDSRLGQLNLDLGDYEATMNSGLNSIEAQRQARRSELASQLRGMQ